VRHEASHASVAVEEGVHPEQPVVSGGGRNEAVDRAEAAVYLAEPSKEARQRPGTDRDVLADLHVSPAQLARHDARPLAGIRVVDPEQVFRQVPAEPPMDEGR
jgi:hypothetical protein